MGVTHRREAGTWSKIVGLRVRVGDPPRLAGELRVESERVPALLERGLGR